jgi:hypothetical protein
MNTELNKKKENASTLIFDCLVYDLYVPGHNIAILDTSAGDNITKVVTISNIYVQDALNIIKKLNESAYEVIGFTHFTHDNEQSVTTIILKV